MCNVYLHVCMQVGCVYVVTSVSASVSVIGSERDKRDMNKLTAHLIVSYVTLWLHWGACQCCESRHLSAVGALSLYPSLLSLLGCRCWVVAVRLSLLGCRCVA